MPNVLQSKVFPLASLQVYVQVSSALSSQGISTSSSCAKASTLARLIADNSFRSFVLKFTLKAAAAAMMATTKIPKILFFIFNLLFTLLIIRLRTCYIRNDQPVKQFVSEIPSVQF